MPIGEVGEPPKVTLVPSQMVKVSPPASVGTMGNTLILIVSDEKQLCWSSTNKINSSLSNGNAVGFGVNELIRVESGVQV